MSHEKKFSCRSPRVYTGRNRTERKGRQMKRWWFGLGLATMMCLGACARGGGLAGDTLSVGQRQEELVARKGQPQEIQPGPGGGKTYIYTTSNLDQTAIMGGGAWVKPDQVYYHINDQGVITEVQRYPYGKRSFIFPTKEKPVPTAPAQVAATPGPAPQAAPPAPAAPLEAPRARVQPPVPTAPATPGGVAKLELDMTRDEVRRLLGPPERTEGCRLGGRAIIVWYYRLEGPQGRVPTPLVFEGGRLGGWGKTTTGAG